MPWFSQVSEDNVLQGQREFRGLLDGAGIPYEAHEEPGSHEFRVPLFLRDLDGIIGRLRKA